MRVHILSDLHLEFGPFDYPDVGADLVIFAGDVHTKMNGLKWILETITHVPVIYIMGNHEYYGAKLPRLVKKLQSEAQGSNVHVCENDVVEVGGFRLIGCTLWTDMALQGDVMIGSIEALHQMNDYKRIRHSLSYKKLRPEQTRQCHRASVSAIRAFLGSGNARRSVVVTHHAPSILSLPEHRRDELISCAYASHLDALICEYRPALWIHGHIHHSHDYRIGDTRVIANPRAYIDEPNPNFDPSLVIELGV